MRDPSELPQARLPDIPPPPTVDDRQPVGTEWKLSLDAAIRMALANSEVVRVLAGVTAGSSGRTIYDTAIANTTIDQEQARFDPSVRATNRWNRFERPGAAFDPANPTSAVITGLGTDDYRFDFGLSKTTSSGGTLNLGVNANPQRFRPGIFPLNPESRSSLDLSFTQPLLQGGGFAVNRAPIVLARIETERSYFQLKGSVQQLVSSVIAAYWSLVSARIDVWAIERQVEQAQFAYDMTNAKFETHMVAASQLAQSRVSLENFRSNLLAAKENVLEREAALRNLLGLPPYDGRWIVPTTPPDATRHELDWDELIALAEQHRPDLIELKLIIEADEQLLLQARNQAYPRVDAVALYRWNGIEGQMPNGRSLSSHPGQFTDWTLGVDFSVPLSLRRERARLRRLELIIARDWANLDQGLHAAVHTLALSYRRLVHLYRQYQIAKQRRAAARLNLNVQMENYRNQRVPYIEALLAINDWGNAIRAEAQYLAQYNAELANLERETGTILETHDVFFYEERFGSLGPLGRLAHMRLYPQALRPGPNADRYPSSSEPSDGFFQLENPVERQHHGARPQAESVPRPEITSP